MTSNQLSIHVYLVPCLLFLLVVVECSPRRLRPTRDEVPPDEIDKFGCKCNWTQWMNNDDYNFRIGDDNSYYNLRHLYQFCEIPRDIKCRGYNNWAVPFHIVNRGDVECEVTSGLVCVSRPYDPSAEQTDEKPFYCDDYEITVQCCFCPTTTTTTTTRRTTTTKRTTTTNCTSNSLNNDDVLAVSLEIGGDVTKSTDDDKEVPVFVILLTVFGCLVIIAFIIIIWLLLTKNVSHSRKRVVEQDFYPDTPVLNYNPKECQKLEKKKSKVSFKRNECSSSDYVTSSSDDEGYRSRPSYSRKRMTKGERDRKLNGGRGNGDDSFGSLPKLDLRHQEESSDEGRFRQWFPDEYERSLQQKQAQAGKTKPFFIAPFTANNRKSIPYMDDLES